MLPPAFRARPGNCLLAADITLESAILPPWAQLAVCEVRSVERFARRIAGVALPIVAVRRLQSDQQRVPIWLPPALRVRSATIRSGRPGRFRRSILSSELATVARPATRGSRRGLFPSSSLGSQASRLMPPRIYLDNAATSWPKPEAVYRAVDHFQRNIGAAAGRSGRIARANWSRRDWSRRRGPASPG